MGLHAGVHEMEMGRAAWDCIAFICAAGRWLPRRLRRIVADLAGPDAVREKRNGPLYHELGAAYEDFPAIAFRVTRRDIGQRPVDAIKFFPL